MSDRPDKIDKFLPETRSAVKRAGRAMSEVGERRDEAEKARVETEPPAAILSARRTVRVLVEMAAWKKTVLAVGAVVLPLVVFVVASRGKDRGRAVGLEGIEGATTATTVSGTTSAAASVSATAPVSATVTKTEVPPDVVSTGHAPTMSAPSGSGKVSPKGSGDPYGEEPGSKATAPAVGTASVPSAVPTPTTKPPANPWDVVFEKKKESGS